MAFIIGLVLFWLAMLIIVVCGVVMSWIILTQPLRWFDR